MFENILLCPNCKQPIVDVYQPSCTICGNNYGNNDGILNLTEDDGAADFTSTSEKKYIGFDLYAKSYNKTRQIGSSLLKQGVLLGQAIYDNYGKNSTVLDIGAGTGFPSVEIASKEIPVIALDISLKMLKLLVMRAKMNKIHNIVPVRANAYQLPIMDHSIDAVTCHYLFHMFNNPESVFQEIKRVLKKGGSFYTILTFFSEYEICVDNSLEVTQIYNQIVSKYGGYAIENIGWLDAQDYLKFFRQQNFISEIVINEQYIRTYGTDYDFIKNRCKVQHIYLSNDQHEKVIAILENMLKQKYGSQWRNKKISTSRVTCKIYRFYD